MCLAIARPVHCVAPPGGSAQVSVTTWRTTASPKGALPGLRAASRSKPSTPASTNRRCQRQTAGRPTRARRDLGDVQAVGRAEDDPSARHMLLGAIAIGHDRLETSTIRSRHKGQTL